MRRLDEVVCVAWDESWIVKAVVADANSSGVVLAFEKVINFPARYDKLPETEAYRVEWVGSGYAVINKRDGARMTSPVHSIAMATRDLSNLFPRAA